MSPGPRTAVPSSRPRWRPRVPDGWTARELVLRVLAVVAACFVLGYLLAWIVFFPGWGRDAIVTVPDLRGKALRQATGLAEDAGLRVVRDTTLPNARIPAGAVLAQVPMPGQEATRGAVLHLILSSGPERHPIPSLRGLGWRDAQALLQRYGFTVRVVQVTNPAPEGRILRVTPEPGSTVPITQVIQMTVSAGPPRIVAPGVTGVTLEEAEARLRAAGLRLGTVTYDPAVGGVLGNVVSQSPAEGDSIRQGGAMRVTVHGTDPNPPPPPADSAAAVPADSAAAPPAAEEPATPAPVPTPAPPPGRDAPGAAPAGGRP